MIAKHRSPGDFPINYGTGKLGHNSPRIPRCSLPVELVTSEDDHVGLLKVKCLPHQGEREVIRVITVTNLSISTGSMIDAEVKISNLEDLELSVLAKVESRRLWRGYENY
jgi:hypothetical protein